MANRLRDLDRSFGLVLRQCRISASLSQEQLADRSGFHRTYISQIERGLKSPSLSAIAALAHAVGRRPYTMLKEAEEKLRGS